MKMEDEHTLLEVTTGGPLKVTGPFVIKGHDGKIIETEEEVFLCRCGKSSQKPFCDDTHERVGFSQ
jgi:CDGSH-type Zn-finger protein